MSDVNKVNTNGSYRQIRNILNPFSANNQSTSQTDISPLQSITRLRHHHSSCTVCLMVQYWGPFSSSSTPHLSPTSQLYNHSVNHPLFVDDTQLQKSVPLSEVTNVIKERNACTDDIKHGWPKISSDLTTTKQKVFSFPFPLPWNLPPFPCLTRLLLALRTFPSLILPGTLDFLSNK